MPGQPSCPRRKKWGFTMYETMQGIHTFTPQCGPPGQHPIHFKVRWGTHDLLQWVNPFGKNFLINFLEGNVHVGGLVDSSACQGSLDLLYFSEAKIRYTFEFSDCHDTLYHFIGEKTNIRPWNLHYSHTTCFGNITNLTTQQVISNSILHFDLSNLLSFFSSLRIHSHSDPSS